MSNLIHIPFGPLSTWVEKAFNMNGGMVKQYLGCYSRYNTVTFDNKGMWEFRYKIQYEKPRVRVVNTDDITLSVSGNIILLKK
jgi:hypothetical protein